MAYVSADARREQLIDAAVQVIAREGADKATTRKIADEARAPLASLHYCFQNKENLLLAVFNRLAQEMPSPLDAPEGTRVTPGELAELAVTRTMEWTVDQPVRARAAIEVILWAQRAAPDLATGFYDTFAKQTEAFLRQSTPPLPDPLLRSAVRVLFAHVDGLTLQFLSHQDRERTLEDAVTAGGMMRGYLDGGPCPRPGS